SQILLSKPRSPQWKPPERRVSSTSPIAFAPSLQPPALLLRTPKRVCAGAENKPRFYASFFFALRAVARRCLRLVPSSAGSSRLADFQRDRKSTRLNSSH